MGTLTTAELISQVSTHLAGRTDKTNAQIVEALNIAQEYLCRGRDWEELSALVSGTLPFTSTPGNDKFLAFTALTNTNPHEIFSFRIITSDGRSRKLRYISPRRFDRVFPEPEFNSVGLPSIYTVWSEKFELHRVQDQAYNFELRMSTWPTPLSTGDTSAKSDFREKDDLLILLAVSWIFGSLGEYERMKMFYGIYAERMKTATLEDDRKPDLDIISPHGAARPDVVLGEPWADPFVRWMR